MKRVVKKIYTKIISKSGYLDFKLNKDTQNSSIILAYHRVNTNKYIEQEQIKKAMYISDSTFEAHLNWLKNKFEIVSLSEMIERTKNMKVLKGKPMCVITFDDGWFDNYEFAYPILKQHSLPATIFLIGDKIGSKFPSFWDICFEVMMNEIDLPSTTTGIESMDIIIHSNIKDLFEKTRAVINKARTLSLKEFEQVHEKFKLYFEKLDNKKHLEAKYRMLSDKEVFEMQNNKIEFGFHSKSHYMLTNLPQDKLYEELKLPSNGNKENRIHYKKLFCYPDGKFNEVIVKVLKDLNYQGATTLRHGFNDENTDLFKLKRFNIHSGNAGSISELLYYLTKRI